MTFIYSLYVYVRELGLLAFLPGTATSIMLDTSLFEILVNIFIYRKMSKLLIAVFSPFLTAKSPEQAKLILKDEAKVPC